MRAEAALESESRFQALADQVAKQEETLQSLLVRLSALEQHAYGQWQSPVRRTPQLPGQIRRQLSAIVKRTRLPEKVSQEPKSDTALTDHGTEAKSAPDANTGVDILDSYVRTAPTPQAALNIFTGEWASKLPPPLDSFSAGAALLFADTRLEWGLERLGGAQGKTVLELGPLEGGHTYMLEHAGASAITAVEANTRAYLKCLIVKELLGLQRGRFLCGDFVEYLRENTTRFDLSIASGVLYHMKDPVELLASLAQVTDGVYLWTHYYDRELLSRSPHLTRRFVSHTPTEYGGFAHMLHRYHYEEALAYQGFCGGSNEFSQWLSRDDILNALKHFGLTKIEVNFEQPDHPNGPSFAVVAQRP